MFNLRLQHTLANSLLVCRNCAFNFDTPGVFSDIGKAVSTFFLRFEGLFEEEASARDGPIRSRVEKRVGRENLGNLSSLPLPPSMYF